MLKTSGSLFLGSQNVNDLKEAINAPENPIPIRALAVSSDKYVFEAAKIRMPVNAMASIPVRVFLAPYLSRNTPSGICVSPKEISVTDEIKPRSAGERLKAETIVGAIMELILPINIPMKKAVPYGISKRKKSGDSKLSGFFIFISNPFFTNLRVSDASF